MTTLDPKKEYLLALKGNFLGSRCVSIDEVNLYFHSDAINPTHIGQSNGDHFGT